jgi:hypothetical protein
LDFSFRAASPDGCQLFDNYPYTFAVKTGMRSLKLIRDSEGKAGNSEDAQTTKDAKEDDYKCTQRIARVLTVAGRLPKIIGTCSSILRGASVGHYVNLGDDWEENTLTH